MPNETSPPLQIDYTPEFKRNLRALAKKYRHLRSDTQPVFNQLQGGEIIGDQIPGTHYTVLKVRIANSDIQKGKRSGYRLIYHLKSPSQINLVTIYSKLDQSDVSAEQIPRILKEFENI